MLVEMDVRTMGYTGTASIKSLTAELTVLTWICILGFYEVLDCNKISLVPYMTARL